jgi:hypothetical protein
LDELSEAQRDALMAWTAAGGDLIVVGGDLEKLFRDPQRRPAGIGFGKGAERYFLGQILFASVEDLASKGIDRTLGDLANNGPNGQRTPWFPPDRFISNEASSGLRKTDTGARSPFAAWQLPVNNVTQERYSYMEDPTRHGFKLPIPGVGGVSTRVYLGILVVFTVIIGPANYMYLKRTRQQVLMVLTTPAISLAFILLLAGYALAGEGFGMHARAESFTFLDQASKQAVTRATVSLYAAGMAPWNGAQFPKDAAVFPLASGGQQMTLDLTDVQQYSSGLMQARTPINFEEIVVRTARERLTFSREGAGISVVNALGVPIKQLVYREGGTVYALKDAVPVGGRGVLERGAGPGLDRLLKPDKPLAGPDTMYIDRSDKFQHFFIDSLADGAFFAVVDRSPFWEPGVSNIVEQGSFHIVAGYAGGEP